MKRRISAVWFLAFAVPATVVVALLSLSQGYLDLWEDTETILQVRLPRILIALFGGAALAIAGTLMQAVFRNPLASPEILGTTQGAALGATVAVAFGWVAVWQLLLPISAVVGALVVTGVVYLIAGGTRGFSVASLLLAGIAMNTLVGALIALAISLLSGDNWSQGSQILFWLMGDLERTTATGVWTVGIVLVVGSVALAPFLRELDLMTLKDSGAQALGVNVVVVRSALLAIACGVTATTVAFTGGVAFIGLVVPHMARLAVGPVHRTLVPCAAALGALVFVASDYACRVLFPDSGLRVGVLMSMLGAPFFLYLLVRLRRGERL